MKGRSIGARLTLWYTTLLAATFVVLAGVAFVLLAYSLSHDVDVALDGVAKIMTKQVRQEGAPYVPSDIDEIFRRFFGFSPLDRYFELLDPFGRRDPRWNTTPPGGKLPLSEEALKKAAQGIRTKGKPNDHRHDNRCHTGDDHLFQGSSGADINTTLRFGLCFSLHKALDLPELAANFFNHFKSRFTNSSHRHRSHKEGYDPSDEEAYNHIRIDQIDAGHSDGIGIGREKGKGSQGC